MQLDNLIQGAHALAEQAKHMRQTIGDQGNAREADQQLLNALCEMKQILTSVEREISKETECPPEVRFPPHVPDMLTVLSFAWSRRFKLHREPGHAIIIFPMDKEEMPIAARMFPDTVPGYTRALRWMEIGEEGTMLKDGFLKQVDIRSLSLLPQSQAIQFTLVEEHARDSLWDEETTYPEHSGIVFPGEPGYQELRTWLTDRELLPATLEDVTSKLRSFSLHIEQPEQESILQWEPTKGYTLVTKGAAWTSTGSSNSIYDILAMLLRGIGFYREKPEAETSAIAASS